MSLFQKKNNPPKDLHLISSFNNLIFTSQNDGSDWIYYCRKFSQCMYMYVCGTLTHFLLTFNKRKCVFNSWTTCFCYYSFDVSIFRMCRFSSDSQPQTKSGIFQIFFRRAQKSDSKPLCRIVVSPPWKMKDLLCCLSRHRKWTLQKSQGTPAAR